MQKIILCEKKVTLRQNFPHYINILLINIVKQLLKNIFNKN